MPPKYPDEVRNFAKALAQLGYKPEEILEKIKEKFPDLQSYPSLTTIRR